MQEYPLFINILGGIAGTLTTAAFFPQVIKVVKTRSTQDLSLVMFLILSIGVILWLVYGLYLWALPIIMANSLTLIFIFIILWYKIKHG